MNFLSDGFHYVEPYFAAYGVAALFVLIFLESCGLPTPGETGLIAAGLLAAKGDIVITHALAAAFFGAVLGTSLGYLIGRFGGRPLLLRFGPWVGLTPERQESFDAMYRARGAIIVVTARFVVLLRQLKGLVAGSVAMPGPRFVAANAVGAAAWTMIWCLTPFFFTHWFETGR